MAKKEKKEVTLQQPWLQDSPNESKKTKSTDKVSEEAVQQAKSVTSTSAEGSKSGALGIPKGTPVYSGQGRGLKGQPIPGTKGFGTAL